MMFESYTTLWHLKMLILWILVNCIMPWIVIYRNKRLRPDKDRDVERFKPFVRSDYDKFSYVACIWTHFFFIPRYLLLLCVLFYAAIGAKLITIGCDLEHLDAKRKKLVMWNT